MLTSELQTANEHWWTECQTWEFEAIRARQSGAPQEEQSDQYPDDHDGEYDGYDQGEQAEEADEEDDVDISAADEAFMPK